MKVFQYTDIWNLRQPNFMDFMWFFDQIWRLKNPVVHCHSMAWICWPPILRSDDLIVTLIHNTFITGKYKFHAYRQIWALWSLTCRFWESKAGMCVTKQAIERLGQTELLEVLVQISGNFFLWNWLEGEKTDKRAQELAYFLLSCAMKRTKQKRVCNFPSSEHTER